MNQMKVTKRNGLKVEVSFDKVIIRMKNMCLMDPKLTNIDPIKIAQKVCGDIYDGVHTSELDELAARICTSDITKHTNFGVLASRIIISNNHKLTSPSFSETIYILYNNKNKGKPNPLVSQRLFDIVMKNKTKLNSYIDYSRDYLFDYFGFKTLEKAYLMKVNGKVVERISHLFMRVSLGFHREDIRAALETYDYMSLKYFTHATPTLFHSGTDRSQLLSCFLLGIQDSVDGIYKTLKDCAKISKWAGGIGVWSHDVRGNESIIRSTNGKSNGLIPMLKVFNDTARHINQSGRRNGSFAFYLEPWHIDTEEYLEAKKNHGDQDTKSRDLFYALWIPDLFMKRVRNNEDWYLLCPDQCQKLSEVYGDDFEKLYNKYVADPTIPKKKVRAQDLWTKICFAQIETGTPYMLYKDQANRKSNQQNLGTIKSSNLCTEIIEYSSSDQYACCTLASIGLPRFLIPFDFKKVEKVEIYTKKTCRFCRYSKHYLTSKNLSYHEIDVDNDVNLTELKDRITKLGKSTEKMTVPQIFITINGKVEHVGGFDELVVYFKPTYDFQKLARVTKIVTRNLNKIIDVNFYPVPETRYSNKLHRPLGIGVQGLADVYCQMRCSFDSEEAAKLNKQIFATIYYSAMEESVKISRNRVSKMKRLKEARIAAGDTELKIRANEFTKAHPTDDDEKAIWLTGAEQPNPDNDELIQLQNECLPLDEELFMENEQYIGAYSSFDGSPLSKGKFQHDLWDTEPLHKVPGLIFDWEGLRENVMKYGARNSLLVAPMPTASTSQILGNNECIEPFTSCIYSRNTIAGTFVVLIKYLINDLLDIQIWTEELKNLIIKNEGSIQNIKEIPQSIRNLYKTSWDLSQKALIDQSSDRGPYVCQSQSLNLWLKNPDLASLTSMHFYTWEKGLKTGLYYLRTRSISKAQQFTITPDCEACSA